MFGPSRIPLHIRRTREHASRSAGSEADAAADQTLSSLVAAAAQHLIADGHPSSCAGSSPREGASAKFEAVGTRSQYVSIAVAISWEAMQSTTAQASREEEPPFAKACLAPSCR